MPKRVEGKVAVVTGAASGIGRACARRLALEGAAAVVLGDIEAERGAQAAAEIAELGCAASFLHLDVSDRSECDEAVRATVAQHGRLDVLVHAAGIAYAGYRPGTDVDFGWVQTRVPLVEVEPEDWNRMLAVNLTGVLLTNQAAARQMLRQGAGAIVNITSMNSVRTSPLVGPYSVAKAGAWMLTKTLALELAAAGIRVNAVGPGYIDTPMNAPLKADPEALGRALANTPMGRLGAPDDVAHAVAYLASDEAAFVTGTLLCPDGGFVAAAR